MRYTKHSTLAIFLVALWVAGLIKTWLALRGYQLFQLDLILVGVGLWYTNERVNRIHARGGPHRIPLSFPIWAGALTIVGLVILGVIDSSATSQGGYLGLSLLFTGGILWYTNHRINAL